MIQPEVQVGCEIVYATLEKGNFFSYVNARRAWVRKVLKGDMFVIDYEDIYRDKYGMIDTVLNKTTINIQEIYSFIWGGIWVDNPRCAKKIKDQLL